MESGGSSISSGSGGGKKTQDTFYVFCRVIECLLSSKLC